jgi:hypothetical protein
MSIVSYHNYVAQNVQMGSGAEKGPAIHYHRGWRRMGGGGNSTGLKRPEREVYHTPLSIADVNNE